MHNMDDLPNVSAQKFIYLTTEGRKTRRPHTVELWFAVGDGKVYLSHEGNETDWMKNLKQNGQASFKIGGKNFAGRAQFIVEGTVEAWQCKVALYEKYYGNAAKEVIEDWFSLSKLIAIEPA
jgi:deazaflavin-dependent oxidoreductase (nitroreductase family)